MSKQSRINHLVFSRHEATKPEHYRQQRHINHENYSLINVSLEYVFFCQRMVSWDKPDHKYGGKCPNQVCHESGQNFVWFIGPKTRFTNNSWGQNWNLLNIHLVLIAILMIQSGPNFEYVTAAELPWHMQNCYLIGSLLYTWGQHGFCTIFGLWANSMFIKLGDIVVPIPLCKHNPPWAMKLTIYSIARILHQFMCAITYRYHMK